MRLLWFFLPVLLGSHGAVGATTGKERRSSLNGTSATILTPDFVETVQEIVNEAGIPGLTLAIVNKTGPPELGAWGIKSENGTNMTTDTLFNLASCSKAFLSASLGIVIDDFANGRNTTPLPAGLSTLTWKTKVADILPNDWKLMDPWASEKANLIDILTHMSGVGRNDFAFKKNDSLSGVTRNLRNFRPTFELREQWQYNNQMYTVGAYIVSTLTGIRFADFVNYRIFKPLGMSSSTYSIDEALQTGRFTDTWTPFGRLIPPWMQEEYTDIVAGLGGVISNVEDLTAWVRMILNGGVDPVSNVTIIPSAEFEVVTGAHSIVSPNTSAEISTELYGLGWFRISYTGHDIIFHDGGAPGVTSYIAAALDDGIGIVVLANADSEDTPVINIILAAAEKAFGSANSTSSSPPANQTNVSRRSKLPRHAGVTARADNNGTGAPSDVDLLAGAYYNAGYGTPVLCSVRSSSPSCGNVMDAFRAVDPTLSSNSSSNDLFASWDTPLSTYLRFTYTNGSQYLIYIASVYPEGYGKNSTPFLTLFLSATAEFVVENGTVVGFGWNDINDDVKREGSVEETSDVWFVKQA